VLDAAKVNFCFDESEVFENLESGRELYVDAQTARRSYLERSAMHAAAIARACGRSGIDYQEMTTDGPLVLALFDFLNSRVRGGAPSDDREPPRSGRNRVRDDAIEHRG
jgi:hypothetical protein